MMRVISVEEFTKRWNSEKSLLLCPKLKSEYGVWLYPLPEDPCKSGDCGFVFCHNYKKEFSDPDRLVVPEKPLPHLLKQHLKTWKEEWKAEYNELKVWAKTEGVETIFDKMLEESDSDGQ